MGELNFWAVRGLRKKVRGGIWKAARCGRDGVREETVVVNSGVYTKILELVARSRERWACCVFRGDVRKGFLSVSVRLVICSGRDWGVKVD